MSGFANLSLETYEEALPATRLSGQGKRCQEAGDPGGLAGSRHQPGLTKTRLSRQGLSTPTGGWELVEDLNGGGVITLNKSTRAVT